MGDDLRTKTIVETLSGSFDDLMRADPAAFRRRFRRMAADPFAFYRGSAPLFYADVAPCADPWADERTSRVWIQGDLHAENFGTYMDGEGVLVFDVNDFDEAYLGHFTWDLRRFAASVALLGWTKALSDDDITRLVESYLRGYLEQVRWFAESDRDHEWALRLDTASGPVRETLLAAQIATRVDLLDGVTVVEDYQRRFRHRPGVRVLDEAEREKVVDAYRRYLDTIPGSKRLGSITYDLKDIVGKSGFGIGSAGLPAYSLLVEGHTQALENDVVLTMKQGNVAAPSRVVDGAKARQYFAHHGHRTAVSQRALQAHADPWLGWTQIDGVGFVVAEFSPYERDLDWADLTEPDQLAEVVEHLGRATAKAHCVSDVDTGETPLVDFQTEDAILEVIGDAESRFVADIVTFAHDYATGTRRDHGLFVDAFRGGRIPGVQPSPSRLA
ncbi:MAG: DUF2252 domain-containing protein [Actinomycetes bacterium]